MRIAAASVGGSRFLLVALPGDTLGMKAGKHLFAAALAGRTEKSRRERRQSEVWRLAR